MAEALQVVQQTKEDDLDPFLKLIRGLPDIIKIKIYKLFCANKFRYAPRLHMNSEYKITLAHGNTRTPGSTCFHY